MNVNVCCLWVGMLGLIQLAVPCLDQDRRQYTDKALIVQPSYRDVVIRTEQLAPQYSKALRFNVYSFSITAPDTGRVREVVVKAYRSGLLLTTYRVRVDGAVIGAEVADLDNNRFPELYLYSTSDGSGSFGRVYASQFLPERKADINLVNWQLTPLEGYMGHDSLWIERDILCRKYPVYRSGDANAEPTGGSRMIRYHLQPAGTGFKLIAE